MKEAKALLTEHNLHNTVWGRIIIAAEERSYFTDEDSDKAGDWTTCACGEQDPLIPRCHNGCPLDEDLRDLGCYFLDYINDDAFLAAVKTLIAIEKRAGEVMAVVNNSISE